jgi:S-adenosylmethionine hydrolase
MSMSFISLTTDFGGGGGVMRGVIWGIYPEAQVADLTHNIPPQDVRYASWYIDQQAYYYPADSVHVVVVDPGVGTERRPIAVQAGKYYFVGPDNGVFSSVYQRAEREGWPLKIVHTNRPGYWLPEISNIFHGRDIFSPVGAHLAAGVPIEELGDEIDDPVRFELPQPMVDETGAEGEVILLYGYLGNIITNIHQSQLPEIKDYSKVEVTIGETKITDFICTFGERETGELVSLFGSTGLVIISVVNGSAMDLLKPKLGDKVKIKWG